MTELADAFADIAHYADGWLAFRQRHLRLPGVQAAVWADGGLVLSTAHGHADVASGIALTPGHLFRVASHSKTFTATAVVTLAEAGLLGLDDRLDAHVPWTAGTGVGDRTLAQLLGHGGGVVRDGHDADHWQLARPFPDDAAFRALATDAAVCPADERFKYSNIAFGLLGAVVAAVSGRTYREFVTGEIVAPLGLADTAPDLLPDRIGDYARGYSALTYADHRVPIEHIDTGALAAATGFTSTAADLARWGAAHLPGDADSSDRAGSLGAASQRRMRRPAWDVDDHDAGAGRYGLGFDLREVHGHATFGHGGGYPGHGTRLVVVPEQRVAVAVCVNAIDGPAQSLADALIGLAVAAAGDPDGAPVDPGVERWCGRYASLWGVSDLVRLGRRLLLVDPTGDAPGTSAVVALEPDGDDAFRVVRTPGYGSYGQRVEFRTDADGVVTAMRGPGGVTMWPLEQLTAFVAGRDAVRPGDLADGPLGGR